jgi:hypothetical protein
MALSPAEQKLAALLLDLAADKFSNHGCNDFHAQRDGKLTDVETEEIRTKLKGSYPEDYGQNGYFMDWLLMRHLAKRLRGDI